MPMNLDPRGSRRTAPFKVGDQYRRLFDGRTFRVDFLNPRGVNSAVFSAKPTDGKWEHDGGPVPHADQIEILGQPSKRATISEDDHAPEWVPSGAGSLMCRVCGGDYGAPHNSGDEWDYSDVE
jgi:hypothetical protein